VILAPHPGENQHPDHTVVARIVRDAARFARYGGLEDPERLPPHPITSLYFYAITQVLVDPPDVLVDISRVKAKWETAILCHRSQMNTRNYLDLVMARARSLGSAIGVEMAAGLWVNDPIRVESLGDLPLSSRYF
jgi:LmbE family N-acetylglucosaminyl deacetylase